MKGTVSDFEAEHLQSLHLSRMNSKDYFVTTKDLRKIALSGRQTSNRNIKYKKFAPTFENRTLDNFPMPHGREDAVRSALGFRAEKRDARQRINNVRNDSGSLRDYSKQMFEFSVKNANQMKTKPTQRELTSRHRVNEERNMRLNSRSKLEASHRPDVWCNGPTAGESALNRCRRRTLNAIRIRTVPEPETRFYHDRSSSCLSIRSTLHDKNRSFRLQSVNGVNNSRSDSIHSNSLVAGSEVIFVPLDDINEKYYSDLNGRSNLTSMLSMYTDNDDDTTRDPFDDFDERSLSIGPDFKPLDHSSRPGSLVQRRGLLPANTPCQLRLVSLDETTSESESEELTEAPPPPPPEVKKPDPPPGKLSVRRGKQVEPEPEPEPVKVKLILKGPHCWVDDATVSSDQSERDELEIQDDVLQTENNETVKNVSAQGQQKTQTANVVKADPKAAANVVKADPKAAANLKTSSKNAADINKQTALAADSKQEMKNAFEKSLQDLNAKEGPDMVKENVVTNHSQIIQNGDIKQNEECLKHSLIQTEPVLPSFICPSSEKKSREAELKHWLASTCFRQGIVDMPVC
ncbi:uncharacterized protein LOC127862654 isoform X2 [Dreissena polymorpha]|uniref:uncharacterized protein LOC127862654 isoform X2 n=1 Tax=Dreissena polymorpha TaxID=45954 RepID=UPI002264A09F|nr:uncharacterized protein LOC127862654 isoform X2 [Dreissena polymorpha]